MGNSVRVVVKLAPTITKTKKGQSSKGLKKIQTPNLKLRTKTNLPARNL